MGQFSFECSCCGDKDQFDWTDQAVVALSMGDEIVHVKGSYICYGKVDIIVCDSNETIAIHDARGARDPSSFRLGALRTANRTVNGTVNAGRIQVGVNPYDRTTSEVEAEAVYCFGEGPVEFKNLSPQQQQQIRQHFQHCDQTREEREKQEQEQAREQEQQEQEQQEQEQQEQEQQEQEQKEEEEIPLEDSVFVGTRFCVPEGERVFDKLPSSWAAKILPAGNRFEEDGEKASTEGSNATDEPPAKRSRTQLHRISVTPASGDVLQIETRGTIVGDLKAQICKEHGIPVSLQVLLCKDDEQPLDEHKALDSLPVDQETGIANLFMIARPARPNLVAKMPPKKFGIEDDPPGPANCVIS